MTSGSSALAAVSTSTTFVEAKKLAYEDRAKFYADPAFNRLPLKSLLSKEYAAARRKLISDTQAGVSYEAGNPALQQGDTVYLTAADRDGNMVSLIQSVASSFGSGMVPDGLGFVLHNRGASYTLEEGHYNTLCPTQAPLSHDHSGLHDQRWPADPQLWGDGWRLSAARVTSRSSPTSSTSG
jgi:gamma-glutamyltranspeptidase